MNDFTDMFLGKPIVFWVELDAAIKKHGDSDFEAILVDALVTAAKAKKEIARLRDNWSKLYFLIDDNRDMFSEREKSDG